MYVVSSLSLEAFKLRLGSHLEKRIFLRGLLQRRMGRTVPTAQYLTESSSLGCPLMTFKQPVILKASFRYIVSLRLVWAVRDLASKLNPRDLRDGSEVAPSCP